MTSGRTGNKGIPKGAKATHSAAQVESLANMLQPTVHMHGGDRREGGNPHPSCSNHGPVVVCVGVNSLVTSSVCVSTSEAELSAVGSLWGGVSHLERQPAHPGEAGAYQTPPRGCVRAVGEREFPALSSGIRLRFEF